MSDAQNLDGLLRWSCIDPFRGGRVVAPSTSDVIYDGTSETKIRIDVSHGKGGYKGAAASRTWTSVGLRDIRHIGKPGSTPRTRTSSEWPPSATPSTPTASAVSSRATTTAPPGKAIALVHQLVFDWGEVGSRYGGCEDGEEPSPSSTAHRASSCSGPEGAPHRPSR